MTNRQIKLIENYITKTIKRILKEETYRVGGKVKLMLNGSNPRMYGMTPQEFQELKAHDGQVAIITKIDDSGEEEWYYDLKFQDGYKVTELSHMNLASQNG